MGVHGFPAGVPGQWVQGLGAQHRHSRVRAQQHFVPRDGRGCTRCSHGSSPAPAQPKGTECGTEGLPEQALALGRARQQGPRHTWAPLALSPLPGAAGQAPGTCWAQLPGLDTRLKDNTSPEVLSVHPELGKIQLWDRKICFPHLLFMAQQKKKKGCKIQTRSQP